ncbi:MAG: DNA (cytosine-5-)-methyltransferase [Fusobacteriaceae bacterium]
MLKVIELFAGVGSQTQALKNIGVDHEVVGIAEINKYAISSYMQLHGETPILGDITTIESLPSADLWTYSFPCQDVSVAGKGLGIKEGTRSGLLSHVERLLGSSIKPRYLLMENVKNLIGKKHKPDFDIWCKKLEEFGYKNFYQVLNSKDYGIPQNRERVFMVSILGEGNYTFPDKKELNIRLKDILEEQVEEKYYLSQKLLDKFVKYEKIDTLPENEITDCLPVVDYKQHKQIIQLGTIKESDKGWDNPQCKRIYSVEGISPTLNTCGGGQREPKIRVTEATKIDYKEAFVGDSINLEQPNSKTRRGRVGKGQANTLTTSCNQAVIVASRGRYINNQRDISTGATTEQRLEFNSQGVSNTITTVQKDNLVFEPCVLKDEYINKFNDVDKDHHFRIRKLTPKECWRLMGYKDEQFDKIQGISNSQLYKQAGNGIVVNVLEAIFRNLFKKR